MNYDKLLLKYYGHNKLKSFQKAIIKAIVEDQCDILGVLSTGYGKSICYQLPYLALKKTQCVIVISPLLSLMEDQKAKLDNLEIPCTTFNSTMTKKEINLQEQLILQGENKIIYISPESLDKYSDMIDVLYDESRLLCFAIDEAHCVSMWGNDFRPDYKNLSCLRDRYPEVPILALTATATESVRDDIASVLQLDNYYEFVSSFDRPNLYIECRNKTDIPDEDRSSDLYQDFLQFVEYKDTYTIVYVRTRDETNNIVDTLKRLKISAIAYHAGLGTEKRHEIYTDFCSGKYKWIVATVAFGMGIDQDIGLIIHYGSPGDLESYYQEIGRAGRNGEPAKCILLYGDSDMRINRILLKDIKDKEFKKYRENQIRYMEHFYKSSVCRRRTLLEYFGEKYDHDKCMNCDNCFKKVEESSEIQHAIQYPMFIFRCVLKCILFNGGINKLIQILMGKRNKNTKDYVKTPIFGIGNRYQIDMWKSIYQVCLINDYVIEETIPSGYGTVIKCTSKLNEWYTNVKQVIKSYKIKSFSIDDFLVIAQELYEEFDIPDKKIRDNIKKCNNNKTHSTLEELLEDL